jgi:hypothetical protein
MLREIRLDIRTYVKCPLLLFRIDQAWNASTYFSKIPHYQISWKLIWAFNP